MADIHIKIEKLNFSYKKKQTVLSNVSLSIYKNEIVTIVGPNGGGKTTLLRLIAGLLEPDSGKILINGQKNTTNKRLIGYVPQHARFDKHFPMTVSDVILSGLVKPFGFYSKIDREKADQVVDEMNLTSLKKRSIGDLSGGQMQRTLIARALVSPKEILLLDEPTANIDPEAGNHLNALIKELGIKMTILLVTHDTGFVGNFTDRVFCINRKVAEHPVDNNYSRVIASSYSHDSQIVRHDITLSGKCTGDII